MPSIKDDSTVEAIAREFTSNGRNKAAAMRTIGYAESSCVSGQAQGDVYNNLRVKAAIKAIDDKRADKADITRELLVDKMYDIVNDNTSTKTERTRAASLIADMIGAKREAAPNKEREQALAARMSKEDREVAKLAARLRTEHEARKGIKLAEGTDAVKTA